MHDAVKDGKRVLVEGANALMLDLDFGIITLCSVVQELNALTKLLY
jgi:adenylosuccinate synthase